MEILEVECVLADFFEAGITNIVREGGQKFWNEKLRKIIRDFWCILTSSRRKADTEVRGEGACVGLGQVSKLKAAKLGTKKIVINMIVTKI